MPDLAVGTAGGDVRGDVYGLGRAPSCQVMALQAQRAGSRSQPPQVSPFKCLNPQNMKATNERWVLLNKDTFQQIFNAALYEMTKPVGGSGREGCPEEPSSPTEGAAVPSPPTPVSAPTRQAEQPLDLSYKRSDDEASSDDPESRSLSPSSVSSPGSSSPARPNHLQSNAPTSPWAPLTKSALNSLVEGAVKKMEEDDPGRGEEESGSNSRPSSRTSVLSAPGSLTSEGRSSSPSQSGGEVNPKKQPWVALNQKVVIDLVDSAMRHEGAQNNNNNNNPSPQNHMTPQQVQHTKTHGRSSGKRAGEAGTADSGAKRRKAGRVSSVASPGSSPCSSPGPDPKPSSPGPDAVRKSPTLLYVQNFVRARVGQTAAKQEERGKGERELSKIEAVPSRSQLDSEGSSSPSGFSFGGSVRAVVPQHTFTVSDASRASPKLGWVAVSKADVHSIIDNVVDSMMAEEEHEKSSKCLQNVPSSLPPGGSTCKAADNTKQTTPTLPSARLHAPSRPWEDKVDENEEEKMEIGQEEKIKESSFRDSICSHTLPPFSGPFPQMSSDGAAKSPDACLRKAFWKKNMLERVHEQETGPPGEGEPSPPLTPTQTRPASPKPNSKHSSRKGGHQSRKSAVPVRSK